MIWNDEGYLLHPNISNKVHQHNDVGTYVFTSAIGYKTNWIIKVELRLRFFPKP